MLDIFLLYSASVRPFIYEAFFIYYSSQAQGKGLEHSSPFWQRCGWARILREVFNNLLRPDGKTGLQITVRHISLTL